MWCWRSCIEKQLTQHLVGKVLGATEGVG